MTTLPQSDAHLALGRAVREVRARRGLTQERLGLESALHRNYVGAIERGEINPSFRILLKLGHGLDMQLSDLLLVYERNLVEMSERRKGTR